MSTRAEGGFCQWLRPLFFGAPVADAALLEALGVATPETDEAKARAALSDVIMKVCTHTWAAAAAGCA
jgi:hypothetical protein